MIKGIQITQAANDNLLNSFWLLDSEKNEARCLCAKAEFVEDQVVAVSELGQIEYRELPVNVAPTVKVEGGQHLNVNVLRRETLDFKTKFLNDRVSFTKESKSYSQFRFTPLIFRCVILIL